MGVDYELTRRVGVYLKAEVDRHVVVGVVPESHAARIGLRPGDVPVNPLGAGPLDLAECLERIEAGREITVARLSGKVRVDTILHKSGEWAGRRSGSNAPGGRRRVEAARPPLLEVGCRTLG